MTSRPIRHVLFDADGVIQEIPGGWYAAMEPYVGERSREFLHFTWGHEGPALAGEGDYRAMLAEDLRSYGVEAAVDEILEAVWYRIESDERSLALVRRMRESGLGVHLGTNQDPYRAGYMRRALGYEAHFDTCFYSCDLGIAKPDPAFFAVVAERIGADPAEILFIDDGEPNVLAARSAGLVAIHWRLDAGQGALLAELARHGIRLA